jgi:hypothetical protein
VCAALQLISEPYADLSRLSQQWEAVLMLERLAIISVSVLISDQRWRDVLLGILVLAMLILHIYQQPFRRRWLCFNVCRCRWGYTPFTVGHPARGFTLSIVIFSDGYELFIC